MAHLAKCLAGIYLCVSSLLPSVVAVSANNQTDTILTKEPILITPVIIMEKHFNGKIDEYQIMKSDHLKYGQAIQDDILIYKDSNTNSETIEVLKKGMIFEIIERDYEFLKISYNDVNGFIDINLTEQYQETPPLEVYEEPNLEGVPHYNPNNLRELSNLSEQQIYNMLEGSALQTLSKAYYYYEQSHNINAIFLIALNSEESGHGKSYLAQAFNNLGGVKDGSGGWRSFGDWGDSLEYIASLLDEYYLTEGGAYYNGLSIYDVNIKYCEGNEWAGKLNAIAYEFLNKIN